MKKIFIILCTTLFAVCIFYFIANMKKDLVVGTSPTFPPLEYIDTDSGSKIIGANVELVELIAKDYGANFKLDIVPFTEIFSMLESSKIDLSIGGLAISDERKKLVDFSTPYYRVSVIALVRKDDSFEDVTTKDELGKSKKLGTRNGSVLEATTKSIANGKFYETKASWGLIVTELLEERIDAVIVNNIVAEVFLHKYDNLAILPMEFQTLNHAIAVKKGNTKLLNSINKTIDKLNASGEYQRLVEKYIEEYKGDMLEE